MARAFQLSRVQPGCQTRTVVLLYNLPVRTSAPSTASLLDRLLAGLQRLLPHHFLSRIVLRLTRLRAGPLKTWAIRLVVWIYGADLSEAVEPDPRAYPHFNAFFTRALRPGARPIAEGAGEVVCPVDGAVSEIGEIEDGRLVQAKGIGYSLEALLGGEDEGGFPGPAAFRNGSFATLYLSPRDYHRVHMPLAGRLTGMVHVPGRLFSVQPPIVRALPGLFTRNERVATLFETEAGPMAVVLVGAIFVAAIETVWAGLVTPPRGREVTRIAYPRPGGEPVALARGAEMGRFNMGSTVIVLFGPQTVRWEPGLAAGATVKMGQRLGRVV